jgi:hypothetical protein
MAGRIKLFEAISSITFFIVMGVLKAINSPFN